MDGIEVADEAEAALRPGRGKVFDGPQVSGLPTIPHGVAVDGQTDDSSDAIRRLVIDIMLIIGVETTER